MSQAPPSSRRPRTAVDGSALGPEDLRRLVEHQTRELESEVAERRRREEELSAERRLLRTVIDIIPDYIYVKDRDSKFIVNNVAVAKNLGCTPDDVIGKTDFDFFPPDLARQFFQDEQKVMSTGRALISREERNYYPITDSWGWHLTTSVPLRDSRGRIIGLVGVSRDITSHKLMEERLRESLLARKVAREVLASQERERQRIAAELHDELGQNLLLVKNKLLLAQRTASLGSSEAIQEAIALVSQTLQGVRDISHNLRPHQLDELGLGKSVEGMFRRLCQASGLELKLEIRDVEGLLEPESEISLYRIAQECLSNIIKHAGASRVKVSLGPSRGKLQFKVQDDGRGFDPAASHGEGMGLILMSERARMLGGTLEIHPRPGGGMQLAVAVPIDRRDDA
jgi:two-component system, NarL family, sensor histidine kinase UhpB